MYNGHMARKRSPTRHVTARLRSEALSQLDWIADTTGWSSATILTHALSLLSAAGEYPVVDARDYQSLLRLAAKAHNNRRESAFATDAERRAMLTLTARRGKVADLVSNQSPPF